MKEFILCLSLTGFLLAGSQVASAAVQLGGKTINSWFYYLGFEPTVNTLNQMINSNYDLVVIEPIFTDKGNADFPISALVADLHNAPRPKQVIAYIDIGQAEDWRTYWQGGWGIGNPSWIVANDPDGWEGNFPVAYWHPEWQDIWLNNVDGYLKKLIDAGFDGIYLDWIEAYSEENTVEAARVAGVDPKAKMIEWVGKLKAYGIARNPNFLVIAQNSAELVESDEYVSIIDGLAQEQTWFDGGAENEPTKGDCPLPNTDNDINTAAYYNSLSAVCREIYTEFPDSTLHVSTEGYLHYLGMAKDKGLPVFTVDYAIKPKNIDWVHRTSRNLGFVPFVSDRYLSLYQDPVPYQPVLIPSGKWKQLAIPCRSGSDVTVNSVFGDDLSGAYNRDWIVWGHNPSTQRYFKLDMNDTLKAGQGYWFIQHTGSDILLDLPAYCGIPTVKIKSSQCTSGEGCFKSSLVSSNSGSKSIWQMLGAPEVTSRPWSDLRVITDTGVCAYANGCTLNETNILNNVGWHYNSTLSKYDLLDNTSVLAAWMGYWISTPANTSANNPRLLTPTH